MRSLPKLEPWEDTARALRSGFKALDAPWFVLDGESRLPIA